jgi:hypothetical protein
MESLLLRRKQLLRKRLYRKRTPRCPVCHNLECLCRPRYFSGQVLTEADLNAEQQYVIKKNRLHNLYLHGWGVVCGLEVLCHPSCEGWISIKQGYAISPCGDDIVVCEDTDFDVLKAIKACGRAQRKAADCTPRATTQTDCDEDGCWYLTLTYQETATRAITALRPQSNGKTPASCACGGAAPCGGCGGGSSCGCRSGSQVSAPSRPTVALTPLACEPSRLCEGFRVELCKAPTDEERCTLDGVLEGTLLERIQLCAEEICALVDGAPATGTDDLERLYLDCCRYLVRVRSYFEEHPTTRCGVLDELAKVRCVEPPGHGGPVAEYQKAVADIVLRLKAVLLQAFVDCLCLQLLPPCPEDPGDERVYLACVNIKAGRIEEICNFRGRRQVWTWPTALYWLSLAPVVPLLQCVLERFCCGEYGPRAAQVLLERFCNREAYTRDVAFDPLQVLTQLLGGGGVGNLSGIGYLISAAGGAGDG